MREDYSIPVVMLKLVVIVMISFAEGKDCEEPRVIYWFTRDWADWIRMYTFTLLATAR